jgi:protein-S-isoprenylcysteine O-methyltransferase Ste14
VIESILVTLFPILFLAVLFSTGEKFRRRNIDMDGNPPIDRSLFYLSKYLIILVWVAMVLRSWGIILPIEITRALKWISLFLWVAGFLLLFMGRFALGDSFRLGSPEEATRLKVDGLFSLSRNPMYVGVYSTLLASFFYTLNPLIFCAATFIIIIHHRIVLAEEQYLRQVFGEDFLQYCSRVRRYL